MFFSLHGACDAAAADDWMRRKNQIQIADRLRVGEKRAKQAEKKRSTLEFVGVKK